MKNVGLGRVSALAIGKYSLLKAYRCKDIEKTLTNRFSNETSFRHQFEKNVRLEGVVLNFASERA